MNVYFQIRSSQLDRSIKGLKEHFRKNSASSALLYSPAVQTKRKDTPTKKVPKRPGKCDLSPRMPALSTLHGFRGRVHKGECLVPAGVSVASMGFTQVFFSYPELSTGTGRKVLCSSGSVSHTNIFSFVFPLPFYSFG